MDLQGHARRRAVRRRRGPRPDGRARLRPARARLRGAARGRRRRRGPHGHRRPSPTTTAPTELAGKEAQFAVSVKEVKAKELPELDDDLAAEAGFDTLDELREDIRTRLAETESDADRGRVPRGRARLGGQGGDGRDPGRARRGRARELWDQMIHSLATRASRARPTCGSPAARRTRSSSRQARRRAGAAARGGARRDHRGRGHRADRGGGARGGRAGGGRRRGRPRRRSCWSA